MLIPVQPTFLIEGGGTLVCSQNSETIAKIVKDRIDIWGKHEKVYKSILLPTLRGYTAIRQLRKADLIMHCNSLAVGSSISIICTTDKLDMITVKIRRLKVVL